MSARARRLLEEIVSEWSRSYDVEGGSVCWREMGLHPAFAQGPGYADFFARRTYECRVCNDCTHALIDAALRDDPDDAD